MMFVVVAVPEPRLNIPLFLKSELSSMSPDTEPKEPVELTVPKVNVPLVEVTVPPEKMVALDVAVNALLTAFNVPEADTD
jgi:hypothetical protein